MDKTVSKTTEKEVVVAPVVAPVEEPTKPTRKSSTNWKIFEDAGFIPVRVKCEGFKNTHPADLSCHTNLVPTTENVLRHMDSNHGGGWFRIKFRVSDGKKSDLWKGLDEAGVELQDFHCPHCRESVPVSPRRIMYHLQAHPGALRVNLDPQVLCMELGFTKTEEDEFSDLYE